MTENKTNFVEHRRKPRRELLFYLQACDADSDKEIGRMIDIHDEGLLLMNDTVLPNGSIYKIKLKMPKALAKDGYEDVILRCKVMWSRPYSINASIMQMGMKFINLKPTDRDAISDLIALCGMPMPDADEDDSVN